MNKSIILIDTPESCSKCPLFHSYYSDMTCRANGFSINYPYPATFRQTWCPLKTLPSPDEYAFGDWDEGYRTCLEDILGEEYENN